MLLHANQGLVRRTTAQVPARRTTVPVPSPVDWQHRDINQARQDHQPFQYNGQQVRPERAGNGDGWGFWFLGQWIQL